MRLKTTVWFLTVLLLVLAADAQSVAQQTADPSGEIFTADVCVYGGTSGGVVAAVQAARMGKRVVLLEPGNISAG